MADFDTTAERAVLSEADAAALAREGVLAMDPNGALPLWFDGRYLTARDLNRQQNYLLARHATLGRSVGNGVIDGLDVALDSGGGTQTRLTIDPGQGISFDGAHIVLPSQMVLNLSDLAVQNALNAQMGLSVHPSAPIHSRTGLFVLSLRAVEYTANQTTSFPTHVTGERSVHMGDRIEAVAATLTPYTPFDVALDSMEARAAAAKRIFQTGAIDGIPTHALPLAMLSMRFGVVEWIDTHLVRRELVASRRDFLGLGLDEQQLRLAHYHQYRAALSDVMQLYADNALPAKFPAEQHFRILPAAGPLPADTVDAAGQAQVFFPGEVEVELSVIPEDELPALIEESFELPPIDLTLPVADRDTLSVMIVAPMPRDSLRTQLTSLSHLSTPLKPLSMLGQGPQKPLDRLGGMKISLADAGSRRITGGDPVTEEWAAIVQTLTNFGMDADSGQRVLWYMRRRTLRRSADLESVLVAVNSVDDDTDTDVPPTPDDGDTEPPTPEPQPDPLPDAARAALMKLDGYGDLRKIAEVQLRRVNAPLVEIFSEVMLGTEMADQPIATTALVARMSGAAVNASAVLKKNAESLLAANQAGMSFLSAALIGRGTSVVSSDRFEKLNFLVTEEQILEELAGNLANIEAQVARELVMKLNETITIGDKDGTVEIVKLIAKRAEEIRNPTPEPEPEDDTRREEERRRRAEEAAATRRAEALLASLPDRGDQARLRKVFDKSKPAERDFIVKIMEANKVAGSRIATSVALNTLSTGGEIGVAQLSQLRAVDADFVSGLSAIEPHLLKMEAEPEDTTPTRPTGGGRAGATPNIAINPNLRRRIGNLPNQPELIRNRRFEVADISARLVANTRGSVNERVRLIAGARNVRDLAKFGDSNRRSAAKLKKAAQIVTKATDHQNANTSLVERAIAIAVRGG